jgi:hypothetical protein
MFPFSDATIKTRRTLSINERILAHQYRLSFLTNLGLGIALVLGFAVIGAHGGVHTTAIAAYGASLGAGGVLGFLFGVPSTGKGPVNITSAGNVAVGTGNNSPTISADAVDQPSASPAESTVAPAPNTPPLSLSSNPTSPSASKTGSPSQTSQAPDQSPDQDTQPSLAAAHSSTSNLEQVADWVTKLLLGGGLTQMQRIPPKVWQWAHIVALGIIGNDPGINDRLIQAQQAFAAGLLVYGFILGFFSGYLITKLQLGKAIAE